MMVPDAHAPTARRNTCRVPPASAGRLFFRHTLPDGRSFLRGSQEFGLRRESHFGRPRVCRTTGFSLTNQRFELRSSQAEGLTYDYLANLKHCRPVTRIRWYSVCTASDRLGDLPEGVTRPCQNDLDVRETTTQKKQCSLCLSAMFAESKALSQRWCLAVRPFCSSTSG